MTTKKRKVTSLDVAQRAGVSQSAVSRVFTPGASFSSRMAEKVLRAAEDLSYRPNVLARSLITGESRIIGVVVAYFENQFYPEALELLTNALQSHGFHVLIFMANNLGDSEQVMQDILDYQIDGIILASVSISSQLASRCQSAGIPVVLFNRDQDDQSLPAVTSNNYAGGRKVAELFIAAKHRRIAYIAGWEGASTQRDREQGFVDRLFESGITLFARAVGNFDREHAQHATRQIFAGEQKPDAVFVANDHMAFGVLDVLRHEMNLDIPEQVSVVGYDDVPLAAWQTFDLTSVRQSAHQMVDKTVELLLTPMQAGVNAQKVLIDGPLILRGSAKIPRGWDNERV